MLCFRCLCLCRSCEPSFRTYDLRRQPQGLFIWEAVRDGTFAGTGRQTGSRHACIYLLFVPFRLYGKNFAGTFFFPSRGEMKSIFKIHFNTDTKIVLTVLKRFGGHETNFKYQIRKSINHGSFIY